MKHFPLVSLGELCEKITDGTHHSPQSFESGAYKYITAKNIKPWGLDLTNLTYVDEKTHKEIYSRCDVKKNDILYIKDGATTGIATINPLQEEFSLLSSVGVLRPGPSILPKYLLYALQESTTKERMMDGIAGVAITRLTLKKLNDAVIPWAPINYQARIVEKLEELLSDLDAGVSELKAAQKKLGQYRQSLLKAAVEGALTAQWRAQHTPTETGAQLLERILKERRARWEAKQLAKFEEQGKAAPKDWQKKYPEPVRPDISDLPKLPPNWVWASGEQLCEFITKGTTPPKDLDTDGEKTVPFLRVTNLTDRGELDLSDKVFVSAKTHQGFLARSAVYPDDVLMNIVGPPLGQVAVVPKTFPEWNINQAIAIFRAVDGVLPAFICCHLLSPVAQKWLKARSKTTAGQTNLTLEVCRELPFPLPPVDEQQALVLHLTAAIDGTARQNQTIDQALKQSAAQRKNILKAAFSGQLVPQDPGDEPAAVLLERIRAERAAAVPAARRGRPAKATA